MTKSEHSTGSSLSTCVQPVFLIAVYLRCLDFMQREYRMLFSGWTKDTLNIQSFSGIWPTPQKHEYSSHRLQDSYRVPLFYVLFDTPFCRWTARSLGNPVQSMKTWLYYNCRCFQENYGMERNIISNLVATRPIMTQCSLLLENNIVPVGFASWKVYQSHLPWRTTCYILPYS